MRKRRVLTVVMSVGAALAVAGPPGAVAATRHDAAPVAPGAPGSPSYFDLARKDCVGTARTTASKVWFTVADGALSDVYWPTIDSTNVHTLQYVVTDGHSFTDVQTRDMTYRLVPDPTGMSCTVIASDAAHHYRITTTYLADPARDAIVMRVHFAGPPTDRLYARLDPLAGGTGGGSAPSGYSGQPNAGGNTATLADGGTVPVAENTNTSTEAVNRTYAVPTYEALRASGGFSAASVGYAGSASDGQTMLDAAHRLTTYGSAPDGHAALTARLRLDHRGTTNLALGFGTTEDQAVSVAGASAGQPFGRALSRYESGWHRYDARLRRPARRLGASADREYYASVNVIKASEDKTFPGAIAAGLASPWGQAVPAGVYVNGKPTYFGSYREVFSRDLYETFTGLLVAGDVSTARAATRFLFDRQQLPDGSMPRNSLPNGQAAPDTGGLQLDETAYPILMDWQSGLARDHGLYVDHVIPAADFLVAHGPSDGAERWEEQSGYSPSTIAAEIAGLTAASHIATANHDAGRARSYQAVADDFARNIKGWDVTTTGPWNSAFGVSSYFIRLSKTGDPNAAISYGLGNGVTGTFDQRSVIDAGFLDLVRLGILPADDPVVQASLKVVDGVIERSTPSGVGFYRYGASRTQSDDGYGDCYQPSASSCSPSGTPWPATDTGTGHLWPVLSGERGEYELAAGDGASARSLLRSMQQMQSGQGLEPEQAWEDPALPAAADPVDAVDRSIGFADGRPAGSASPLTWAQAQYARLARDLSAGRDLETPGIDTARYTTHGMPGALPVTITSPTSGASVTTSTVTVTGTTAPGATVDGEAVGAAGGAAGTATATADASGNWTLTLPASFGSTTITITATQGRSTGYAQTTVTDVALPGTTVLDVSDPTGDDNGPGTFQYPTAADFQPGGFDLTGLSVSQTATDVYVQVRIRNLAPVFGEPFGAQLLDVYVRNPSAASTSTAAFYPSRNYTVASGDAWSERLEAQAFAPAVWQDTSGNSLGTPRFIADAASGTATLIMPVSTFGTVGSGWTFTVALTGQNGFSADQARGFTQPAQDYTFGVCPVGDTAAICSLPPGSMPEVMDTITPPATGQADELNPVNGPVVLHGVAAP